MGTIQKVLNALGSLFDTVAGIPPGELQNEIGFLVITAVSLGLLHVSNPGTFATTLSTVVLIILGAGVALERAIKAAKGTPLPNPALAIGPATTK